MNYSQITVNLVKLFILAMYLHAMFSFQLYVISLVHAVDSIYNSINVRLRLS